MKMIFGKPIAEEVLGRLKNEIARHRKKPGLAVILVGEDPASKLYVDLKEKAAKRIGMKFFRFNFFAKASEDQILETIEHINADENISAMIVQLPLPKGFDTGKILNAIDPKKDADGFLPESSAFGLEPVFPSAIVQLAQSAAEHLMGKRGLVVAHSEIFGQAMTQMLEKKGVLAEFILSDDIQSNLGKIEASDIVVSAVGSPGLLRGEMFKEGAIVIDGGISKKEEKVVGDVDFASFEGKNISLSPVPGGVGPVTIACLLENTVKAFKAQQK